MIPEPQRTYVLELLAALGPAAKDFVIAGAQAIKFTVKDARGTKDVDFILNVIALRAEPLQLEAVLKRLSYTAIAGREISNLKRPSPTARKSCASSSWPRRNSSGPPTSAWMYRKGSMRAPVPEARSRSPSRTSIRWKGGCRTANRMPRECVSPGRTRW